MLTLLVMSGLLGLASFGCGMLPLSMSLSSASMNVQHISPSLYLPGLHAMPPIETHFAYMTTIGTGMLLGTALGVIIPECAIPEIGHT